MPLTIWKAQIRPDNQTFNAPEGAELLTAREQGDELCVWFRCDPSKPITQRRVEVCGTGHTAPIGRYIGSGHFDGGALVVHVFEPA